MKHLECRFRVPGNAPTEFHCTHPNIRTAGQIVTCDVCAACSRRRTGQPDATTASAPARAESACDFEALRGSRRIVIDEADWSRMVREGGVVRCEIA